MGRGPEPGSKIKPISISFFYFLNESNRHLGGLFIIVQTNAGIDERGALYVGQKGGMGS